MKKARIFLALLTAFLPHTVAHAASFDSDTLVFIGSSTIDFWKSMDQDFAPAKTRNLGKAGTTFPYLIEHADEWAREYPAHRYVIYSGDNDVAWSTSPEEVANNFLVLAEALRRKIPGVEIYVISIKPCLDPQRRLLISKVRKANEKIKEIAERLGYVTYVDTHNAMLDDKEEPRAEFFRPDGIHLSAEGYDLWTRVLKARLH